MSHVKISGIMLKANNDWSSAIVLPVDVQKDFSNYVKASVDLVCIVMLLDVPQ